MLPRVDVVRWRAVAPWADDDDVEQDLVITLALFDIFRDETLRSGLAFLAAPRCTSCTSRRPPGTRKTSTSSSGNRVPSARPSAGSVACSAGSVQHGPTPVTTRGSR